MPSHKSTAKSMHQQQVRHQRNVAHRSKFKTAVKKVLQSAEAGDVTTAKEALAQAIPIIDRTCSKGVIHKNKAARHKSKLSRRVGALTAQAEK